jgi:hypothetical protein
MIDLVERLVGFKFNKRGRIVVGWTLFVIFLSLLAYFNHITTPEQCRVPVEEMSTFCKNLLYP